MARSLHPDAQFIHTEDAVRWPSTMRLLAYVDALAVERSMALVGGTIPAVSRIVDALMYASLDDVTVWR